MKSPKIFRLIMTVIGLSAGLFLLVFIAMQFVPLDQINPPVVQEPNWDSLQTRALAERACFDCHSNQTQWPWYSKVAPVSWLVTEHVIEGRAKLNFSEWGLAQAETGQGEQAVRSEDDEDEVDEEAEGEEGEGEETEEIIEEIQEGKMPLPNYLVMHPEARLSNAEIQQLIKGLEATFGPGAEAKADLN
jgi:hypothetical protein